MSIKIIDYSRPKFDLELKEERRKASSKKSVVATMKKKRKLPNETVLEIKRKALLGMTAWYIAKELGICQGSVQHILEGRAYKDVVLP